MSSLFFWGGGVGVIFAFLDPGPTRTSVSQGRLSTVENLQVTDVGIIERYPYSKALCIVKAAWGAWEEG